MQDGSTYGTYYDPSLREVPPPCKAEEAPPWTRRQLLTLAAMCATNTAAAIYYSLLAPFFVTEAKKKGATFYEAGIVLGCFQIVVLLTSPIFGLLLPKVGVKFMFVTAIFVGSSCGMLFGVLEYCPDGKIYVVMCVLCRSLEACACAASTTASFTMSAHHFPARTSTVVGLLEASASVGLMAGPPLGGLLFSVGGFKTPFLVTGGLFMSVGIMALCILPPLDESEAEKPPKSRLVLLTHPAIWAVGFLLFSGNTVFGFIDISLSPQLHKIGVQSNVIIGVLFLVPAVITVISAPVYGYLSDRFGVGRTLLLCGSLIGCLAFFFVGPSPILPDGIPRNTLWLTMTSLAVSSVGYACLVLTFQEFIDAAQQKGFPDNIVTHGLISGIFNVFFAVGSLAGPVGGGFLLEVLDFGWSCTVMTGLSTFFLVLLAAYFATDRFCLRSSRDYHTDGDDEDQRLINEDPSDRYEVLPQPV